MKTSLRMSMEINMAASYVTSVSTLIKGVCVVPVRLHSTQTTAVCQYLQLQAAQCRPLHVSAASLCSPRTEQQRSTSSDHNRAEGEAENPEYIPKKKAKNPMMPVGYAWMIGLPTGIIGFILAKREVDKNRLKQVKIRQRMKKSNEGKYEGSRYHHHAEDVKLEK